MIPSGTYNNVLRVTHFVTVVDSVFMGTSWSVITNNTTRYHWYLPGVHYPIAFYESFIHPTASYIGFRYLTGIPLSVYANDFGLSSLTSFPNPASEKISFNIQGDLLNSVEILVYNLNGEVVTQEFNYSPNSIVSANVSSLSNGVYFAEIKSPNFSSKKIRFIVIR